MAPALEGLRARLDALREGRKGRGAVSRVLVRWLVPATVPEGHLVGRLDRDLDRVGIHTAADAALLREAAGLRGRAGAFAQGLLARAREAQAEFEKRVRDAERRAVEGLPPGLLSSLERDLARLARVVRVAEIFQGGLAGSGGELLAPRAPDRLAGPPADPRVAVAAFWAERGRSQVWDFVQRRRDLDQAHELLLRLAGAKDRERTVGLRTEVSAARERARAVPQWRSLDALVRGLRRSTGRGGSAYAGLRAVYEAAVEAGDGALAGLARDALGTLLPTGPALSRLLERDERASAVDWPQPAAGAPAARAEGDGLSELAWDIRPGQLEAFEAAAGCARYFDVEDALSEEVVSAVPRARRLRRVPYPTERMAYELATGLHEVGDFVIRDPRTLMYDLAAGQQQVRAYLELEPPAEPRRLRKTAVRVYVLDASGSMMGARARFRDAVLVAELNNLRLKSVRKLPVDPLYFSHFNEVPTELSRVDDALDASREMAALLENTRAAGKTDITLALITAFNEVRAARGRDPYLSRATVVLVTDGEDRVDLEQIRAARKPVEDVEIVLSLIALGAENADLRGLVEEQRALGGRAFYHHLSDAEISAVRTAFETRFRTLLPRDVQPDRAALEALQPHLEALGALAEGRAGGQAPVPPGAFEALFPAEPALPENVPAAPAEVQARAGDLLDAVAEAASLVPWDRRAAEAVTLLHHLLATYGLPVGEFQRALAGGERVSAALATLRRVCLPAR